MHWSMLSLTHTLCMLRSLCMMLNCTTSSELVKFYQTISELEEELLLLIRKAVFKILKIVGMEKALQTLFNTFFSFRRRSLQYKVWLIFNWILLIHKSFAAAAGSVSRKSFLIISKIKLNFATFVWENRLLW